MLLIFFFLWFSCVSCHTIKFSRTDRGQATTTTISESGTWQTTSTRTIYKVGDHLVRLMFRFHRRTVNGAFFRMTWCHSPCL